MLVAIGGFLDFAKTKFLNEVTVLKTEGVVSYYLFSRFPCYKA